MSKFTHSTNRSHRQSSPAAQRRDALPASANARPRTISVWFYQHFLSSAHKRLHAHRCFLAGICMALGCAFILISSFIVPPKSAHHVVMMARSIPRGTVIQARDVRMADVPSSLDITTLVVSANDAVGKMSPVRLSKGLLIPKTVLHDVPVVPKGYTSLDISLASSFTSMHVGERISLLSAQATLSSSALVLHIPSHAQSHALWEINEERNTAITVALPAQDALRIVEAQSTSPIIAVPHEGTS